MVLFKREYSKFRVLFQASWPKMQVYFLTLWKVINATLIEISIKSFNVIVSPDPHSSTQYAEATDPCEFKARIHSKF